MKSKGREWVREWKEITAIRKVEETERRVGKRLRKWEEKGRRESIKKFGKSGVRELKEDSKL